MGMQVRLPKSATVVTPPPSTGGGDTGTGGTQPTIGSVTTLGVAGKAMELTIPSTIGSGELMVLMVGSYGNTTAPTGWTQQQAPADLSGGNGYIFTRIRASTDTTIPLTFAVSDSHNAALIGIKSGLYVHKNSTPVKGSAGLGTTGLSTPVVTNTVPKTLNIWLAYTNGSSADANTDVTWSPNKTRAAAFAAPKAGSYYGYMSVVSAAQSAVGDSEATVVTAPTMRPFNCLNLISVSS